MGISVVFFDLGDTLAKSTTREWLPGAQTLLADLKSGGFRLGIISNTGTLANRAAILGLLPADFDFNTFDSGLILFSSEVGLVKPDPGIFQMAVNRTSLPAADSLYCSENIVETLVAQHVGMRSIRVLPPPGGDLPLLWQRIHDFRDAI